MKKFLTFAIAFLFITTVFVPVLGLQEKAVSKETCIRVCPSIFLGSNISPPDDIFPTFPLRPKDDTPDSFSWRDVGGFDWTTPAKHQQVSCGSCWAFSALGVLESVIKIKEENASLVPDLSEQYLLSCLSDAGDCIGGSSIGAFHCIFDDSSAGNFCNGVIHESCFPYLADDSIPCSMKCDEWMSSLVPITDFGFWFPNGSVEDRELIKSEILKHGPVTSCIAVTQELWDWGFSNHDENDFFEDEVELDYTDHLIMLVGWKDDGSIDNGGYWICKNSWGQDFGYDGFFNLEYGALNVDAGDELTYITWVEYDPSDFDWGGFLEKPSKPVIEGPSSGKPQVEYSFTIVAADPQGEDISYLIDWGDDSDSSWLGPYESEQTITVTHTWEQKGDFTIRVKARDESGFESVWSDSLPVAMPRCSLKWRFFLLWDFFSDFYLSLNRDISSFFAGSF